MLPGELVPVAAEFDPGEQGVQDEAPEREKTTRVSRAPPLGEVQIIRLRGNIALVPPPLPRNLSS